MKQRTLGHTIAGRPWSYNPPVFFYVAQVVGDGGVDWGYTRDKSKALPLNTYFLRRFQADCQRVGATPLTWKAK
jgi:hypothetical protein